MSENKIFENKILVLDGAMGTMIQRYGLEEIDFHDNGVKKTIRKQMQTPRKHWNF